VTARSLWRILRVLHGVAEAMELQHEHEAEKHHRLLHGLQQVGAGQALAGRGGLTLQSG
jgi:tellurite resistance-related uncharacterized protein